VKDGRAKREIAGPQDGVIVVVSRLEPFDEFSQGVDAQAASE
jgi:hypothetical protein